MKAVILAAGMGKRIRHQHVLPKGFIKFGKLPIIEESIQKLQQSGITEILIVTGYECHHYEKLAAHYSSVSTIKNNHYEHSGSLYSLMCAQNWLDDDFILLESDLVYDKIAITELMNHSSHNIILLSGYTHSSDEVYVESVNNYLINMSKKKHTLNNDHIKGEFVGINKISYEAYRQLIDIVCLDDELLNHGDYETHGLVTLTKKIPLYCHTIEDLIWCEIDDSDHLERAKKIYERLNGDKPCKK